VDGDFNVIGKWPLADARSEEAKKLDPNLYDTLKTELYNRIRQELDKNETPGI
jgi:protein SCO1